MSPFLLPPLTGQLTSSPGWAADPPAWTSGGPSAGPHPPPLHPPSHHRPVLQAWADVQVPRGPQACWQVPERALGSPLALPLMVLAAPPAVYICVNAVYRSQLNNLQHPGSTQPQQTPFCMPWPVPQVLYQGRAGARVAAGSGPVPDGAGCSSCRPCVNASAMLLLRIFPLNGSIRLHVLRKYQSMPSYAGVAAGSAPASDGAGCSSCSISFHALHKIPTKDSIDRGSCTRFQQKTPFIVDQGNHSKTPCKSFLLSLVLRQKLARTATRPLELLCD